MALPFNPVRARIELLQMKAALQRQELVGHVQTVKANWSWTGGARHAASWLLGSRFGMWGKLASQLLGNNRLTAGLARYPWLGGLVSVAAMRWQRPLRKAALRSGVLAALAGGAAWWWIKIQNSSRKN